jgi:hypothetical protein
MKLTQFAASDWVGIVIFLMIIVFRFGHSFFKNEPTKTSSSTPAPTPKPDYKGTSQSGDPLLEALGKRKTDVLPPVPTITRRYAPALKEILAPASLPQVTAPLPSPVSAPTVPTALTQQSDKPVWSVIEEKIAMVDASSDPTVAKPHHARLDELVRRLKGREEARWSFLCQEIFRKAPGLSVDPSASRD